MSNKLLATGGARKATAPVSRPVIYHFVGSFNSGKATLAAQISARSSDFELRLILHLRDNYTISYARLNPDTMAVPTMEIDDWVLTDSHNMVSYLMENCPGTGDQAVIHAGRRGNLLEFIDFVREWDEYMFTYGHMGEANSEMANGIRLAHLRQNLAQVLAEQPADKDFLVDAYVQKIANIQNMKRAQVEGAQKERDLAENIAHLHRILARGNELVEQSDGGFLFGDELTSADVVFLPIFRIFHVAVPSFFAEVWARHPSLRGYWACALAHPDVEAGLMRHVRKGTMLWAMLSAGAPREILSWKLGFTRAPPLPNDIEQRIVEAANERWTSMDGRL